MGRRVFVTVGSTSFDDLVSTVSSMEVLQALKSKGFTQMTIQIGRGTVSPPTDSVMDIESFTFKDDLEEEIRNSALVISHAGAGSIIQSLENSKPLIVVINDKLMDNHQTEFAGELERNNYLKCCYCKNLESTVREFDDKMLTRYRRAQPEKFLTFLDNVMGYGN